VRSFVTACLALLFFAPVADAGTLTARPDLGLLAVVAYEAAPGETNRVRLSFDDARSVVTVVDSGAIVTATGLCRSIDEHTAECAPFWVPVVRADLGDGNDTFLTTAGRGPGTDFPDNEMGMIVNGGLGDDLLDAHNGFWAWLDGGGGRDHLIGTSHHDLLRDGDASDPGPDVIDGRRGADHLSYRDRRSPVTVDLASDAPAGERGEADTIHGIEGVTGGAGDDRLVGDRRNNTLDGGPGHDILDGRRGDDRLGFNAGNGTSWWLGRMEPPLGDPYSPAPRIPAFGDEVTCGRGEDVIWGRRIGDFVEPECESVVARRRLDMPKPYGGNHDTELPAYPRRRGDGLDYSVFCSSEDDWESPAWRRLRCFGTVRVREAAAPHRTIARGAIPRGNGTIIARLRLTRAGRRLTERAGGVRARLLIRGENVPRAAWTIRLEH
jgi:Ca2+-binding RTX toxin-like protein